MADKDNELDDLDFDTELDDDGWDEFDAPLDDEFGDMTFEEDEKDLGGSTASNQDSEEALQSIGQKKAPTKLIMGLAALIGIGGGLGYVYLTSQENQDNQIPVVKLGNSGSPDNQKASAQTGTNPQPPALTENIQSEVPSVPEGADANASALATDNTAPDRSDEVLTPLPDLAAQAPQELPELDSDPLEDEAASDAENPFMDDQIIAETPDVLGENIQDSAEDQEEPAPANIDTLEEEELLTKTETPFSSENIPAQKAPEAISQIDPSQNELLDESLAQPGNKSDADEPVATDTGFVTTQDQMPPETQPEAIYDESAQKPKATESEKSTATSNASAVVPKQKPKTPTKPVASTPSSQEEAAESEVVKAETQQANWEIRAAQPGRAVLYDTISQEMKSVEVGDNVLSLGRIKKIEKTAKGWIVQGTETSVSR